MINIKLLKLDDLIKHKVHFIKIDIEGYEYNALEPHVDARTM